MTDQYDIVLVNFDPVQGSETGKTRPCVIISPDAMNHNINTIIVAPMTSTNKSYPSRVEVQEGSYVVLDQIRTIDKRRVIKKLDALSKEKTVQIKAVLKEMLID